MSHRLWEGYHDEMEADALETWRHKIEQAVHDFDYMDGAKVRLLDDGERFQIQGYAYHEFTYELELPDDSEHQFITNSFSGDEVDGDATSITFYIYPTKTVSVVDLYSEGLGLAYDDDAIAYAIADRLASSIQPEIKQWFQDAYELDQFLEQERQGVNNETPA